VARSGARCDEGPEREYDFGRVYEGRGVCGWTVGEKRREETGGWKEGCGFAMAGRATG